MTEQTPMERLAENAEMNPIGLGHHGLCIVLKADVRSVLSDFARLTAENERLRGALEPFAEACSHLHPSQPDEGVTLDGFTCADFRRAYTIWNELRAAGSVTTIEARSGEGAL